MRKVDFSSIGNDHFGAVLFLLIGLMVIYLQKSGKWDNLKTLFASPPIKSGASGASGNILPPVTITPLPGMIGGEGQLPKVQINPLPGMEGVPSIPLNGSGYDPFNARDWERRTGGDSPFTHKPPNWRGN